MPAAIAFTFGTIPIVGVGNWADNVASAIDSLAIVDRDGIKVNTGRLTGRAIRIRGRIVQDSELNMRAAWAAILAALYDDDGGNIKAALTAFDDRQITAQVSRHSVDFNEQTANMHTADYTIDFITEESYWEAVSSYKEGDTGMSTGSTFVVSAAHVGDAPSWPGAITVSSATGLNLNIVLTNNTTGAIWTYKANLAAAHDLVINMKNHTVTDDGSNAINDVDHPDTDWWLLRGGVENTIQLDFAGGAGDAIVAFDSTARYYNL